MIGLRHIGIVVIDIERSLQFYRDLLGLKIIKDQEEYGDYIDKFTGIKGVRVRTVKMKTEGGGLIELLQYYSHPSSNIMCQDRKMTEIGCSHFALTVKNIDDIYHKLLLSGIRFYSEPIPSPDGYAKVAFCKDPDGVLIELVEEL